MITLNIMYRKYILFI